jgi:hypothetical protein
MRSAISLGSVMLSCWVERMETSGDRIGLNPTLSYSRFQACFQILPVEEVICSIPTTSTIKPSAGA